MTRNSLYIPLCILLIAGSVGRAFAQDNNAVEILIQQGVYWQSTAEWSKAETAWEKVLLNDRNHPDALRGLFYNALQAGRVEDARTFRDRLSQAHPEHSHLALMDVALDGAVEGRSTLNEARRLVQAGNVEEGLLQYRLSFGDVEPNGPLALEYYSTLGGTENGWQSAADGFQRLTLDNPDDWSIALSYAKHLTYNVNRRREGIDLLIGLAKQDKSRTSAIAPLKEALSWLAPRHEDIPRYEAFLRITPDEELTTRLKKLRLSRTPEQQTLLERGYAAMDESTPDAAASRFERLLRLRPRDADALAGLGLVEQRRGNFERAAELLKDALRANGGNRRDWQRALDSSRYWAHIETARNLIIKESYLEASKILLKALEIDESEEVGLVMMAESLHALDRSDDAERYYLAAIEQNPANAVALRGLGQLYNETERFDDAEMLALRLNDNFEGASDPVADEILAQGLVARARTLLDQDELDLAQVAFEQALKKQDSNPWIRLELAQLLVRRGRDDRARLLMEDLAESMPNSATALHAQAEFAYLESRYRDALAFLERVPAGERTPQMIATQNRIWLRLQVQRAIRFAQNNDFGEARRTLGEAENVAGSEPDMAGPLATGWIELGEDERALSIMRTALRLNPDIDLQLQYAGLLLKTRKNEELSQVIRNLKSRSDLGEIQARELFHIEVSLALRKADQNLRDRQYANAYSAIEPFIDQDEDYPEIRMMLGRLYQSTGDKRQALVNYDAILRDHPNHLDARRAAVGTLIDDRQFTRAQKLVDEGLALFPEHPRMVLLAGQLEASQGRPAQALEFFRKALVLISNGSSTADDSRLPDGTLRLSSSSTLSADLDGSASLLDVLDTPSALALESVIGLREEVLAEIGKMNARRSSFVQVGGQLRNRSGESGLDKLSMFRLPARFEYSVGNSGRLALEAAAESLNADDIQLSNTVSANRFGALSLDTSLPRDETLSVSESGVGLLGAYESKHFRIDVGTTPTDYPVTNVVGGLSATNAGEAIRFTASISRREVKDSVLSYAGRLDPFLGVTWGGVVRTGGDVKLLIDKQNQGFYGSVGAHSVDGENVASNSMTQFGAGVFWRIRDSRASSLRIGLDIDTFSYDRNLSFHTFGHGGYFSPQSYVNLGVPIRWSGESGQLQYQIDAKIGFERFDQDDVEYFPNNASLQLQLEELAQTADEPQMTFHRGGSSTGINIGLSGEISYQVSPKLSLGSTFFLQSSGDYNESQIGLFARYYFSPQETRTIGTTTGTDILLSQRGL